MATLHLKMRRILPSGVWIKGGWGGTNPSKWCFCIKAAMCGLVCPPECITVNITNVSAHGLKAIVLIIDVKHVKVKPPPHRPSVV